MLITGGEILITGSLVIRLHHVISSPFFKSNSKFVCAGSLTNFAHRLDLYRSGVIADAGSCWIMLDGGDVETGSDIRRWHHKIGGLTCSSVGDMLRCCWSLCRR